MAAGLTLPSGGLGTLCDFINERLEHDVERAIGSRALLLDALLAPRGVAGQLCDAFEFRGPFWCRMAEPAGTRLNFQARSS